jgi:hypothetical protein
VKRLYETYRTQLLCHATSNNVGLEPSCQIIFMIYDAFYREFSFGSKPKFDVQDREIRLP